MIQLKRILLATDLCPAARHTLRYAVSFARAYRAELWVQYVTPDPPAPRSYEKVAVGVAPVRERIHEYLTNEVAEMVPPMLSRELEIKAVVSMDHPATEIVRFADENAVDLIIIGTHNQKRPGVHLGSVAERVIRSAAGPVLTVPPYAHDFIMPAAVLRPVQLHSLLLPMALSEPSPRALRFALSLSEEYRARLILLSVADFTKDYPVERDDSTNNLEALRRWASTQLSQVLPAEFKDRFPWETRVVEGEPYREILRGAEEEGVDLIVLGAHRWSPLMKIFRGTTAEKVIRHAPVPVLTVKY